MLKYPLENIIDFFQEHSHHGITEVRIENERNKKQKWEIKYAVIKKIKQYPY